MSDCANASVTIVNPLGLHARPAMMFAETAGKHGCVVKIRRGDQEVDGTSVMEIMLLAATKGTELELSITGEGADACLHELRDLIGRGFDED